MQAMEISRTALDVEWRRLEVIAENLANANSTGTTWQPQRLLSGPRGDFAAHLDGGAVSSGGKVDSHGLHGVAIYSIEAMNLPPRLVHEPANPAADANGMVSYPGVDHAAEMTLMMKTSRAYEANIVAMNTARQMYTKALELSRSTS
jgi:flagellar basal-body rod protein FlgC